MEQSITTEATTTGQRILLAGEMDAIVTLQPTDVLCGRGTAIDKWIGNVNYRKIVQEYREKYYTPGRFNTKFSVAAKVIQAISSQNPPGRFVECIDENLCTNRFVRKNEH